MPYEKMNLWQKFILAKRNWDGTTACGNVHFSPNSLTDYDWKNPEPILSTWRDWHDHYPNLTGEAELFDPSVYLPKGIGEPHACRLHHRWWFSCMPHAEGRTDDGWSHSWWDYFSTLEYAEAIRANKDGTFTVTYRSGDEKAVSPDDPAVRTVREGDRVTAWVDGKHASLPL